MEGMTIPSGTIDTLTSAIATYFFQPIVNTVFQNQLLEIIIVFLAAFIMTLTVAKLLPGIIRRGHKESYISGFEKGFVSGSEDIDDVPLSSFSSQGVADAAAGTAAFKAGMSVDESAKVRAVDEDGFYKRMSQKSERGSTAYYKHQNEKNDRWLVRRNKGLKTSTVGAVFENASKNKRRKIERAVSSNIRAQVRFRAKEKGLPF